MISRPSISPFYLLALQIFLTFSTSAGDKCQNPSFNGAASYPLVILSLDGFAERYLRQHKLSAFDYMKKHGAHAKHMIPIFPTKTYPNHASIATGTFADVHGIVGSTLYDESVDPKGGFTRINQRVYYKAQPIWEAAKKKGKRVQCVFWFRCNYYDIEPKPANAADMTLRQKFEKVISWLNAGPNHRPDLTVIYHSEPDTQGHRFGTSSRRTHANIKAKLDQINTDLTFLFDQLTQHNAMFCVNVVVFSDHGMTPSRQFVSINEAVKSARGIPALLTPEMRVADDTVARVHLAQAPEAARRYLISKLQCSRSRHYFVYDRRLMPKRFHYAHSPTAGDLILEGRLGVEISANDVKMRHAGNHGYDFIHADLYAIFFAVGPNIAVHRYVDPFQNIELFNLFSDLLQIGNEFESDGTPGALHHVTRELGTLNRPAAHLKHIPTGDCTRLRGAALYAAAHAAYLRAFPGGLFATSRLPDAWHMTACNFRSFALLRAVSSAADANLAPMMTVEKMNTGHFAHKWHSASAATDDAYDTEFGRAGDERGRWAAARAATANLQHYTWRHILANPSNSLNGLSLVQVFMPKAFIEEKLRCLEKYTSELVRKQKRALTISGTIYDYDLDGRGDTTAHYKQSDYEAPRSGQLPTHIFRILLWCADQNWVPEALACTHAGKTRLIAFVLPLAVHDPNCLDCEEYLMRNSARVRDVEMLTGVEFFADRHIYPDEAETIRWRIHVPMHL